MVTTFILLAYNKLANQQINNITMKIIISMLLLVFLPGWLSAQSIIPGIELRNPDGKIISSEQILKADQAYIMIFWKSYNTKCSDFLENIQSVFLNQLNDKEVKLVAICVDHLGAWNDVKPMINGKEWEFDIYIDSNGDFKRAMGVIDAPFTLLFNKNHEIICRYTGYYTGDEEMFCKKIISSFKESDASVYESKSWKL